MVVRYGKCCRRVVDECRNVHLYPSGLPLRTYHSDSEGLFRRACSVRNLPGSCAGRCRSILESRRRNCGFHHSRSDQCELVIDFRPVRCRNSPHISRIQFELRRLRITPHQHRRETLGDRADGQAARPDGSVGPATLDSRMHTDHPTQRKAKRVVGRPRLA